MKTQNVSKNLLSIAISTILGLGSGVAYSTPVVPDAGTVMQQMNPVRQPPVSSGIDMNLQGAPILSAAEGGKQFPLKQIKITGNSIYSQAELLAVVGNVVDKSYDYSGLKSIANKISEFYRENGYSFARAYLPAQDMNTGILTIDVLEGRYGKSTAIVQEPSTQEGAQAYLDPLVQGEVIDARFLERVTLILDDVPGYQAIPAVKPGSATGTGDVDVRVLQDKTTRGDVGIDNHGSRYTGYNRLTAGISQANALRFGDEVSARMMATDEQMLFGNVNYSTPINSGSGLRANLGYSRTQYTLGKEYQSLDSIGTAETTSLGVSYPIFRSQPRNLYVNVGVQHKALMDHNQSAHDKTEKSSNGVPVSFSFDSRDSFGGGGITYGSLGFLYGSLSFQDVSKDKINSRGDFNKMTFDLARVQVLPDNFTAFARLSAQKASKNLDSSEDLLLGGINGVRAYPQAEATGDEGYFIQSELRYTMGDYTSYMFYDMGSINSNAQTTTLLKNTERSIAGGGIGLRYAKEDWTADVLAAWRTDGGKPQSDTSSDPSPRLWGSVTYKFGYNAPIITSKATPALPVSAEPAERVAEKTILSQVSPQIKTDTAPVNALAVKPVTEKLAATELSQTELLATTRPQRLVVKGKAFTDNTQVEISFDGNTKRLSKDQIIVLNDQELSVYIRTGNTPSSWMLRVIDGKNSSQWLSFVSN